jgi:hypothetical protein
VFDPLFRAIEDTELSRWLLESESLLAFPGVLVLHVLGMALLCGMGFVVAMRLLGFGAGIPLGALAAYRPVIWLGFAAIMVSGLLLVIAYPTKAMTNPLFYFKLVAFTLAMIALVVLRRRVIEGTPTRRTTVALSAGSLVLWAAVIVSGRLLAYTYTRLTVDF